MGSSFSIKLPHNGGSQRDSPKLIQPLSAFSKGGSRGDRCENVGLSYLIGIETAVYPVTDRRIGNDDGCGLKAGQIEGFGGGHTGDAVFRQFSETEAKGT